MALDFGTIESFYEQKEQYGTLLLDGASLGGPSNTSDIVVHSHSIERWRTARRLATRHSMRTRGVARQNLPDFCCVILKLTLLSKLHVFIKLYVKRAVHLNHPTPQNKRLYFFPYTYSLNQKLSL